LSQEILAGTNWRNLPMLGALSLLPVGNLLVHLEALGLADTAEFGNRLGIATLLVLISLVGGRIIPSFTHNWLAKARPTVSPPVPAGRLDLAGLIVTGLALLVWAMTRDARRRLGLCSLRGLRWHCDWPGGVAVTPFASRCC
jgi:uncharacterized protein involved in response to NO